MDILGIRDTHACALVSVVHVMNVTNDVRPNDPFLCGRLHPDIGHHLVLETRIEMLAPFLRNAFFTMLRSAVVLMEWVVSAKGQLVVWVAGLDSWDSLMKMDSYLRAPLESQITNPNQQLNIS